MKLLLDTHIFLWWLSGDPSLPPGAGKAIGDPESDVFVSAATAWEIAIKHALGRLRFPISRMRDVLEEAGFAPLGIEIDHAVLAGALPQHHGDPFDRMLVAQARHEGLTLVSVDPAILRYDVSVFDWKSFAGERHADADFLRDRPDLIEEGRFSLDDEGDDDSRDR